MKQWRKQLRTPFGSTRWQSLPVQARGLARELFLFADDDGLIRLDPKDREAALWRLIGAHPYERRTLSKHLKALVERGTCVWYEDALCFPNFPAYQRNGFRDDKPRAEHVHSNGTASTERVHSADIARAEHVHEIEAKCPESHDRKSTEIEIEIEEETDQERAREPASDLEQRETAIRGAERDLRRAYQARFHAATEDEFQSWGAVRAQVSECAKWAAAKGPAKVAARVAALMDGAFADPWMREHGYPWGAIAKNPTRFAQAARPAARPPTAYEAMRAAHTAALARGDVLKAAEVERAYYDTLPDTRRAG